MPTKNELESLESLLRKLPEEDQAPCGGIIFYFIGGLHRLVLNIQRV